MPASTTDKSKSTDFGKRLSSRDPAVRAAAQAEIEQFGAGANDLLFAELNYGGNKTSSASMWWIMASQLPSFINMMGHTGKSWAPFFITFYGIFLLLMVCVGVRAYSTRREQRSALTLALAERGDNRVLAPLLQIWRPKSAPNEQHSRVIQSLTNLFAAYLADRAPLPLREEQQQLIRARLGRLFPASRRISHTDFSDAEADLLATLAQYLARTQNDNDARLLARIAAAPTTTLPNRQFVQEVAAALRDTTSSSTPTKTLTQTLTHFTPVPTPTIVTPLTNRRP